MDCFDISFKLIISAYGIIHFYFTKKFCYRSIEQILILIPHLKKLVSIGIGHKYKKSVSGKTWFELAKNSICKIRFDESGAIEKREKRENRRFY